MLKNLKSLFYRITFHYINWRIISSLLVTLNILPTSFSKIRESLYIETDWQVYKNIINDYKEISFIFLPYLWKKTFFEKMWFLKNINNITFELPKWFINKDPYKMKSIFLWVSRKIDEEYSLAISKWYENIKVISFSAWNGFWFYLSNKYKVEEFVSVVTWDIISKIIFENKYLKYFKQDIIKNWYDSFSYTKNLSIDQRNIDTYYNCDNLPLKSSFYLSKDDISIPFKFWNNILKKAKFFNPKIKSTNLYLNHVHTIIFCFYLFNIKNNVIILNEFNKLNENLQSLMLKLNCIKNKRLEQELSFEDKTFLSLYKIHFLDKWKTLFNESHWIIKYVNAIIFW